MRDIMPEENELLRNPGDSTLTPLMLILGGRFSRLSAPSGQSMNKLLGSFVILDGKFAATTRCQRHERFLLFPGT